MSGGRRKILVADDNEDNRRLIVYHLGKLGEFEFSEASNGYEVLERVRAERPDLIVMDLKMPELHGWDTLRALEEMPERASFRVLAMSVGGVPDYESSARACGCDDYMATIFIDVERFRRTVLDLLARDD